MVIENGAYRPDTASDWANEQPLKKSVTDFPHFATPGPGTPLRRVLVDRRVRLSGRPFVGLVSKN